MLSTGKRLRGRGEKVFLLPFPFSLKPISQSYAMRGEHNSLFVFYPKDIRVEISNDLLAGQRHL
jgi:hypothetical protein